jgi:hypothetical protein
MNYEFETAISFAGKEKPYVRQVANILGANDMDVYYDEFEEVVVSYRGIKLRNDSSLD